MGERSSLQATARAVPLPDRQRTFRRQTVHQVAKLIIGQFEELCIIREVSAGGLKAEVYCPVPDGLAAVIELRTGYRAAGRIAWCQDDVIGLAFAPEVVAATMVAHCSLDGRIGLVRPTRLLVSVPGLLEVDGGRMRVELRDASLEGMKIRVARPLTPDMPCMIEPDAMDPRAATIRWHRAGLAGIQLREPLRFDEFAAWRLALAERPRRLWVID